MAEILRFPAQASKLGYKRVRRRTRDTGHPDQLELFSQPTARIIQFAPAGGTFDQALTLDERGEPETAADLYRKAIEEGHCVADAYCNLGIIESQNKNTSKAFDCFTTSLKHDPRHVESHYNLGDLYFELNDFRLAQTHFEMAVEIEPSFASAHFNLALVRAINGDFPGADAALAACQKLVPEADARRAGELLADLRSSLAAASRATSS
ncbi:MAG TPA: tetratricopeptide repeat protein [Chthoniobacteraceae bacterium]|nr:tetratricopeptide repeat protein [Chthoniobacteraceae bacterium]